MKPNKGDYMDNDENWIHTEVLGQKNKKSNLLSNLIVVLVLIAAGVLIVLAFQGKLQNANLSDLDNLANTQEKNQENKPAEEKPKEPEEVKYKVLSGDTLAAVGDKFGVGWQQIAEKNNLQEPYALEVDQELIIPGVFKKEEPVVGADTVVKPAETPVAPAEYTSYTVKAGDTLAGVGLALNVDWQKIAQANNIASPYSLEVGLVLKIPK